MIKIESIRIEHFRGIRDITLNLAGLNFAVCGPNGTGKSGVVDALEFALTGSVSRLSGEGTDGISVKTHAPHVDCRDAPEKARVTVTATIPGLGKTLTIVRTVKSPNAPQIRPNDPDILAVMKNLEQHPEFALTRRELIRYVLSPPGKRSKEVQALLRLDRVEEAREALQKVANKCHRAAEAAVQERDRCRDNLRQALSIPKLTPADLLTAVNTQRGLLSLEPIAELTAGTSLKDGMLAGAAATTTKVSKAQATNDLSRLRSALNSLADHSTELACKNARDQLTPLVENEPLLKGLTRESFYRTALTMIEAGACPLCDVEWDPQKLREHIESKLAQLATIARQRKDAEASLRPCADLLNSVATALESVVQHGAHVTPRIDLQPLRDFRASVAAHIRHFGELLPLAKCLTILTDIHVVPQIVMDVIAKIELFVAAIPEPTKQDAARDFLSVAQDRFELSRKASLSAKTAQAQADLTKRALEIYATVSTSVLNDIYKVVETDFAKLYRDINSSDENAFSARLTPSIGKLGFEVDFYGRGHFPPGAYHSEGHQDGMGLCLYLALMRHLLKGSFNFAVLDDVLMSVDSGHRREVCSMLKKEFPDTQFILTTHDDIWLRHMKAAGLITAKSAIHFRNWNVDHGPVEWDDRNVWDEIADDLRKNDVRSAAALLRHYLEYMGGELCRRLRAQVEYRGDGQMQLGEVLPPAIARLKDLYKRGKNAANSWSRRDVVELISAREVTLLEAQKATNVDQWQINPAVHYNEWARLSKEDFEPVVGGFKALLDAFRCDKCSGLLHAVPDRGPRPEILRCECNLVSIGLQENAKA